MNILAIDTSGPACSVALSRNGALTHEIFTQQALTHSETCMPMLDSVLSSAKLNISDIDLFAAVAGPGSFTGVRIGVCVVRALTHALNKPAAKVNALSALAAGAYGARGLVCPILDARRGQVYCAAFDCAEPLPARALPDAALPLDEFISRLPGETPLYFTGDGVLAHGARIKELLGERASIAPEHMRSLRASSACALARLDKSLTVAYDALTPIYLRAPQAERERAERETRKRLS